MNELAPCPFCGSTNLGSSGRMWPDGDYVRATFAVRCMDCGALGPDCTREDRAQWAWGARVEGLEPDRSGAVARAPGVMERERPARKKGE